MPLFIHFIKSTLFKVLPYANVVSPSVTTFFNLKSVGSIFNLLASIFIVDSTAKHPCDAPYPLSAPAGILLVYTTSAINLVASTLLYIGKVFSPTKPIVVEACSPYAPVSESAFISIAFIMPSFVAPSLTFNLIACLLVEQLKVSFLS